MSVQANVRSSIGVLGVSLNFGTVVTADDGILVSPQNGLNPGNPGALTTRGGNTSGTITVASNRTDHNIPNGSLVDIYWVDPATAGEMCRVGMTATDTGTADVTIDISGGAGDNLPVQGTAVVISVAHGEDMVITGSNLQCLALKGPLNFDVAFNFTDASNVSLAHFLVAAGFQGYIWYNVYPNPLAGLAIKKVFVSCDDTSLTSTKDAFVAALYD